MIHRQHHRSTPRIQGQPDARLVRFLADTLAHVHDGEIGRQTGADAIRAWVAIHPADISAKAAAIRQLATAGGAHA